MDEVGLAGLAQTSAHGDARRERMRTPDEIAAMLALKRKRGDEARLPARATDVLGRPGAWSFGPTLWSTSVMTRRTAGIGG